MSHDVDHLISAELRQLDMLIEPRRALIMRNLCGSPAVEDLDALAALLHSAYTAMERIMTHVAKKEGVFEEIRSKSFMWHAALLKSLSVPSKNRSAVISEKLHASLKEYLGFRHVFRHAYLHELQWSKMHPLVENLEETVHLFKSEIDHYLQGNS